ncbi:MAG: M23 family metallopeptidase, partial [Candidatus Zixiibacteriota bacterium]
MKRNIDLSSGFGDLRTNRFHAGIDIRTGGKIGEKLYSPVDGYVWRIKMSYDGYGKGLYVRGYDGLLYVFGHLEDFEEPLNSLVKTAQLAEKRYYLDLTFPDDSIKVIQGQLLGYSGQTGAGAPHLHFEVRTPDNKPINPLSHGYDLKDHTRPEFTRLGFKMTDNRSLFYDGSRKFYVDVKPEKKAGRYYLGEVLFFNRPFGILTECYDRMRPEGMKQAVYKLTLQIDNKTTYEVVFDTVDFDLGRMINFEYDYLEAVEDRPRVRRLFEKDGNAYPGSHGHDIYGGIVGLDTVLSIGLHRGRILAEDCFGNKSELNFKFIWGPETNMFRLDSTVTSGDISTLFYFTPLESFRSLKINSVTVLRCWKDKWFPDSTIIPVTLKPDLLVVESRKKNLDRTTLKLTMKTEDDVYMEDHPFYGIGNSFLKQMELIYKPLDDGLMMTVETGGNDMGNLFIKLYRGEEMVKELFPSRYLNANQYLFFIPPEPEYKDIDRVEVMIRFDDGQDYLRYTKELNCRLVGLKDSEDIVVDSFYTIHLTRDNFYNPMFITWEKSEVRNKSSYSLNSELYHIFPEAFITRSNFELSCRISSRLTKDSLNGLCWLDPKKNKWVWLEDNEIEN